ncbi:hypothetical protein TNIN_393061 [Trichonephila inaurata madagascariensis]|uniref:Uncharacterized protein n=1 Tax=Trichonephila inaurata madagascariensis TaxID=2747483 RepID=A0A8X6YYK3_9ARAC|nr:hypothetical protein TNIN_393061 [Trichonephila inaurata madagascariensis]
MLEENTSQLLPYRRRLERLAGILKFQQLLKQYPIPVKVKVLNEHGFFIISGLYHHSRESALRDQTLAIVIIYLTNPKSIFVIETIGPRRCTGWNNTSQGLFEKSPMSMLEKTITV